MWERLGLGSTLDGGKAHKASMVDQSGGRGQSGQDEVRIRQRSDLVRSYRSE